MVGIRQARSIQDEKLVEAIISTSQPNGVPLRYQELRKHVIIDARPTTNAMANRAIGAGSENMDHYRYCRKIYLGIENIHIMREALSKVMAAIRHSGKAASGYRAKTLAMQAREGWCKHVSAILEGAATVVKAIEAGEHVLIHCSDGWDRTSQLTSLAQLCLDPYYRTLQGFAVLIEKEWVSFGYKFTHRSGLLNQSHKCHVRAKTHSRNHESHSELIGGEAVATAAIATTSSPSSPSLLARGEPRRPSSKKKVSPAGSEATSLRGQGGGFFDNISSSTGIDFAQHSSAFSKFAS
ncbi:phosphatidylinositol-3-phosphatase ymr1, partial [Spiromyces aspiralis]